MATTIPAMNISLTGKGLLTELTNAYTFNMVTKIEKTYSLISTDPTETIDLSDVQNLKYMMFLSDSDFELSFTTATEDIKFTTNLFLCSPATTFTSGLTSVTIKALSTPLAQKIEVRLYGVSA